MPLKQAEIDKIRSAALRMRINMLKMTFHAGANGGHLGGGFSCAEILASLFLHVLKHNPTCPAEPGRDRFFLSKGHASLAYYAALCECGYVSSEDLMTFEDSGGDFPTHLVMNICKGIEFSSGSLGWGLSFGLGCSLAGQMKKQTYHTYVLLGDGECNEGCVWEAFMAAAKFRADGLTAVIDANCQQLDGFTSSVMPIYNFGKVLEGLGWSVVPIDGHEIECIIAALETRCQNKPTAVIANTVKGKGVSFMEGKEGWHHVRLSEEQYNAALSELEASR